MITQEQQIQGAELIKTLAERAWASSSFKEQLIKNPAKTISSVTGRDITLPENTMMVVEDQTDNSVIYLNIPRKVSHTDLELTDEQLEAISGGEVGGTIFVCAIVFLAGYGLSKM